MNTVNDGPNPGNIPKQSNPSSSLAAVIDNEWFNAHPGSTMYKRDVIPGEVPSSLGLKNIRKVRVGLIADGVILYEFDDKCGDAVGYSLSFANATDEGQNQANFCLKLLNSLASLGSEDG
jgi:ABC-type amino acid transport substrate-binding protein